MAKKFTITFAGDTSLGDYYLDKQGNEENIERLHNEPLSFFAGVKPLVKESDYFILNFESVLAGHPTTSLEGKVTFSR
ncbi:metallophosphoesterase family protein [Dethiobacter alkaliphilus]|uniref:Mur ligase, middle domain protein n=1 Tax=Dethiobacter alkaliphilus AHT 1 TaxID=555088 RepID=C0GGT5_DETAL|nr:CapA family protein [Dethiobacter alkaliphilus]EEG77526.1 Mur ligase, middle domain protein [Dethiobacter alkaliphilus AHT 1]